MYMYESLSSKSPCTTLLIYSCIKHDMFSYPCFLLYPYTLSIWYCKGRICFKGQGLWVYFNHLAHASTFVEVRCACAMYSLGMNIWYLFMHKKYCGCHVTTQSTAVSTTCMLIPPSLPYSCFCLVLLERSIAWPDKGDYSWYLHTTVSQWEMAHLPTKNKPQ